MKLTLCALQAFEYYTEILLISVIISNRDINFILSDPGGLTSVWSFNGNYFTINVQKQKQNNK